MTSPHANYILQPPSAMNLIKPNIYAIVLNIFFTHAASENISCTQKRQLTSPRKPNFSRYFLHVKNKTEIFILYCGVIIETGECLCNILNRITWSGLNTTFSSSHCAHLLQMFRKELKLLLAK